MISTSESFCYCLSQDIGVMDPDGYEKPPAFEKNFLKFVEMSLKLVKN